MQLFADFDETLIQRHVQEFQHATGKRGKVNVTCIHKSKDAGRHQMVFSLVQESGGNLVLKKDFQPNGRWIERELSLFNRLQPYFARTEGLAVPTPVYLGEDKSFHITTFVPGRTATDMLQHPQSQAQANQVFRRCGSWLNHLHHFRPAAPTNIWTNWIFEEVDRLISAEGIYARPTHYTAFLDQLQAEAQHFQASPCVQVFSHGDFHGGNLILGKGTVCGLDLAYSAEKPALYDVVDLLSSDVNNPRAAEDIGPGGIRRASVTFFFKTYRQPLSRPLLNFHLRARLLLELLHIQKSVALTKPRTQARFDALRHRLVLGFAQPLDS